MREVVARGDENKNGMYTYATNHTVHTVHTARASFPSLYDANRRLRTGATRARVVAISLAPPRATLLVAG